MAYEISGVIHPESDSQIINRCVQEVLGSITPGKSEIATRMDIATKLRCLPGVNDIRVKFCVNHDEKEVDVWLLHFGNPGHFFLREGEVLL